MIPTLSSELSERLSAPGSPATGLGAVSAAAGAAFVRELSPGAATARSDRIDSHQRVGRKRE